MFYMTPYIANKFTKHLEPIKAIDCVDRGGCGIVALSIYETLSSLGYRAKIINCNLDLNDSNETLSRRFNDKGFMVAAHYVVRVGNLYFDSHGAFSFNDLYDRLGATNIYTKPIYKKDLQYAIDHGDWNTAFYEYYSDINKTIKYIKDHISSFKIGNNQNRNSRLMGRTHRLTMAASSCS